MTGCYKYEAGINTDQFFTCACDHLTNFALLLDVNQSSENPLGLKIISLIGCGISLAGLSLTLLTLIAFRYVEFSSIYFTLNKSVCLKYCFLNYLQLLEYIFTVTFVKNFLRKFSYVFAFL